MNDSEFENWVTTAFSAAEEKIDTTDLAKRVLRAAQVESRLRRGWLTAAAFLGALIAILVMVLLVPVNVAVYWADTLRANTHLLRTGDPDTVFFLCLILFALAALRLTRDF
jgi:H+/Cl- antiporter ClcA